jgi:hypothetical protein
VSTSGPQPITNARAVAAELRFIADWLDENCRDADLYASLSLGPGDDQAPERDRVALVDRIGLGLTGNAGSTGGNYIHSVHGRRGPLYVGAQTTVAPPAKRELEEELVRLRAEVSRLRAANVTS